MKVFLDESGNTYANWFDMNQPYFVYGGWIIKEEQIDLARNHITKVDSLKTHGEMKSKELLKNHKKDFYVLMNQLIDEGAIPFFVIYDKRYILSARLVELVFDITYNTSIKNSMQYNIELKSAITTIISKDYKTISRFAEIIAGQKIDAKTVQGLIDSIKLLFNRHKLYDVASSLEMFTEDRLLSMADELIVTDDPYNNKPWHSLTATALFHLLVNIDPLGDVFSSDLSVTADKIAGFDIVFSQIEDISKTQLNNISSISTEDSKSNKMLHAADYLCGYINRCFNSSSVWSKDRASKDLLGKIVYIDHKYQKYNAKIIGYDFNSTVFINMLSDLLGKKANKQDYSFETIQKLFPSILN